MRTLTLQVSTLLYPGRLFAYAGRRQVARAVRRFVCWVAAASVIGVVAACIVLNLVVFAAQIGRLPVNAQAGSVPLGRMTPKQAAAALAAYNHQLQLELSIGSKVYTVPAQTAGITVDAGATISRTTQGKGYNRLPLVQAWQRRNISSPLVYTVDQKRLNTYIDILHIPAQVDPVDAALVLPNDPTKAVYIEPEQAGESFDKAAAVKQITQAVVGKGSLQVVYGLKAIAPKVSAAQLTAVEAEANALLERDITVTAATGSYHFTAADLRTAYVVRQVNGLPKLQIDTDALGVLLMNARNSFYKAPGSQRLTTYDGVVTGQSGGGTGLALDVPASAPLVAGALYAGKQQQEAVLAAVPPTTTYARSYSHTSKGLETFFADFAGANKGKFAMATVELNGTKAAGYNADTQFSTASTYKLYLAYAALVKIERGELRANSATGAGTVTSCIDKMIVNSDNTCAEAVQKLIGQKNTQAAVQAAGLTATQYDNSAGGDKKTTANDLVTFLVKLQRGELLNASHTSYLLDLMNRQVYRSGIPAGSHGAPVADKVGFLGGTNNDAAIVYSPGGSYVLVVLTEGSNFATIKSLADGVYQLYN